MLMCSFSVLEFFSLYSHFQ
uniref:Uncharacterized protein n=1 Tax=Rhizophora mucronata TaxID=61149 RepID=A0A2P2NF15_RHIMU